MKLDTAWSRTAIFKGVSLKRALRISVFVLALGLITVRADVFTATVKDSSAADEPEIKDTTVPPPDSDSGAADKISGTPHFWQRDSRGGFANAGRDYCCPVAVSNSLVYLAHHGFSALLPDGDGDQPQIDLINLLASPDYFGTDPSNGTPLGSVLSGIQKYVENMGYHCERLEYEGWRKVGERNLSAVKAARPSLDWLKDGIRNPHGSVWLNIGWYTVGAGDGEWKRTGGHWVTLVGYDDSDSSGAGASHLFIHNPATRGDNDSSANDVITLEQMTDGTLDTGRQSTEDASGRYKVSGPGLPLGRGVDAAFLDAAIVLVVGP